MATKDQVVLSEWSPLHIAVFRAVWFASLAANVGTWFQQAVNTEFVPIKILLDNLYLCLYTERNRYRKR